MRPPEAKAGREASPAGGWARALTLKWVLGEKALSIQMKDRSNSCSKVYILLIMGLSVVSYLFFSNMAGGYKMSGSYLTQESETLPHCHRVSGN